jgi:hypothetical protein
MATVLVAASAAEVTAADGVRALLEGEGVLDVSIGGRILVPGASLWRESWSWGGGFGCGCWGLCRWFCVG